MELRGFDHYEVTLGDEMRGERASRGKTLSSVAHDLRIKAELLEAIENCDAMVFPNASVVSGYVRSYARYLGMDAEEVHRRFCEESGFVPPTAQLSGNRASGQRRAGVTGISAGLTRGLGARVGRRAENSVLEQSRFVAAQPQRRFARRISLGAMVSSLALVGVVVGLGYGAFALMENFQRVGFEPLPQAPEVVASAPEILRPATIDVPDETLSAEVYGSNGALAHALSPAELPRIARRDGPISSIDPLNYGAFARAEPMPSDADPLAAPEIRSVDDAIRAAEAAARGGDTRREGVEQANAAAQTPDEALRGEAETGVAIRVTDTSWLRVRGADGAVIFEGILGPGDRFDLPERLSGATLRAGNAGSVYVVTAGLAFGPVGAPGQVVKNVSLDRAAVRTAFPANTAEPIFAPENQEDERSEPASALAAER